MYAGDCRKTLAEAPPVAHSVVLDRVHSADAVPPELIQPSKIFRFAKAMRATCQNDTIGPKNCWATVYSLRLGPAEDISLPSLVSRPVGLFSSDTLHYAVYIVLLRPITVLSTTLARKEPPHAQARC